MPQRVARRPRPQTMGSGSRPRPATQQKQGQQRGRHSGLYARVHGKRSVQRGHGPLDDAHRRCEARSSTPPRRPAQAPLPSASGGRPW